MKSRLYHYHSQNLNEDHNGRTKGSKFCHGRAWLSFGKFSDREYDKKFELHWEWKIPTHFFHFHVTLGGDETDLQISIGLLIFYFYFDISGLPEWSWRTRPMTITWGRNAGNVIMVKRNEREIGFSIHDGCLWISLWKKPDEYNVSDPWWQHLVFNFEYFFLGKPKYNRQIISEHSVKIPMPEGAYPAVVKMCMDTWSRARWFAKTIYRADVNMLIPIPHEGKGENSWDCGKDALHGLCTPAKTIEDAIAKTVESALRSRRKYDSNVMAEYPNPLNVRSTENVYNA